MTLISVVDKLETTELSTNCRQFNSVFEHNMPFHFFDFLKREENQED